MVWSYEAVTILRSNWKAFVYDNNYKGGTILEAGKLPLIHSTSNICRSQTDRWFFFCFSVAFSINFFLFVFRSHFFFSFKILSELWLTCFFFVFCFVNSLSFLFRLSFFYCYPFFSFHLFVNMLLMDWHSFVTKRLQTIFDSFRKLSFTCFKTYYFFFLFLEESRWNNG